MNAALLIAGRELREKYRLFIVAAALAALPFVISVTPFVSDKSSPTAVAVLGGMAAFSMALGSAAVLGATTIGRELSENRLSFYFSKPISPAAIWAGKSAAGLFTCLVCFGIIVIPTILYARGAWAQTWPIGGASVILFTVIGSVALFFVMHAASTMARSRSPLVALDFVLVVAAGLIVAGLARPLALGGATKLVTALSIAIGVATFLVFALAPVRQLAAGRTDRRRSHVALSKVLWAGIGAVLLLAAAFTGWIVSASPEDLTGEVSVAQAPASGWMIVGGTPKLRGDYHASFLADPAGRYRRMDGPLWWGADFSRDGKTLVWARPAGSGKTRSHELFTLDLTRPDAEPVGTGITFERGDFVLSDGGRRVALRQGETVSIHDLRDQKMLFSGRVLGTNSNHLYFVSDDLVRAVQWPPFTRGEKVRVTISEIDVARRTVTKTGETEEVASPFGVVSSDGSRMILRREGLLVDGRTGATIARYGPIGYTPAFLRDGTVVLPSVLHEPAHLAIARPGVEPLKVAIPGMRYALVRGEIAPGKVLVQAGQDWEARNAARRTHLFVIDSATAKIERVHRNMRGPLLEWNGFDPRPLPLDGARSLPVHTSAGKIVMWNPQNGEQTPSGIGQ